MKIAFQMDLLENIDISSDSTICMIEESIRRGFETFYYTSENLCLQNGIPFALGNKIMHLDSNKKNKSYLVLDKASQIPLANVDVVLMRNDPPTNMHYITSTYILEKLPPKTLVLNDPKFVRDLPEKLFICKYPELMPPTLVTQNLEIAMDFINVHHEIVIKPLYEFGGRDIIKISKNTSSLESKQILHKMIAKYKSSVMLQKFLPAVKNGDKRVIMIDGSVAAVINRIPEQGKITANMATGGTPQRTTLTNKEKEICDIISKELQGKQILFAGLDLIDEFITELNVTSPTGIRAANNLYNLTGSNSIEHKLLDAVEKLHSTIALSS